MINQVIFDKYIKHLKMGFSPESFADEPYQDIELAVEKFPEQFSPNILARAKRKNLLYWEQLAIDALNEEGARINPVIFQTMVRHRFGWGAEKTESVQEELSQTIKPLEIIFV